MTAVTTAWAVVEIDERGAVDAAGTPHPIVTAVYGPFDTKAEALKFADQYNAEDTNWSAAVRPLIKFKITARGIR